MGYETQEESVYGGAPIELYRFYNDTTSYTYTNSITSVTYNAGGGNETYAPIALERNAISISDDGEAPSMVLRVQEDNPVAVLFQSLPPSTDLNLRTYRYHDGASSDVKTIFLGKAQMTSWSYPYADIEIKPITSILDREWGGYTFGSLCPHRTYSTQCGLAKDSTASSTATSLSTGFQYRWDATVTTISTGNTIAVSTASAKATALVDDVFKGGMAFTTDKEWRTVTASSGGTMTLHFPFDDLSTGNTISLYRGDTHTFNACGGFGNTLNYGGFPYVPRRDPYRDGLI